MLFVYMSSEPFGSEYPTFIVCPLVGTMKHYSSAKKSEIMNFVGKVEKKSYYLPNKNL